jgi:hypothetical protein
VSTLRKELKKTVERVNPKNRRKKIICPGHDIEDLSQKVPPKKCEKLF